jgi:hypothetical protein
MPARGMLTETEPCAYSLSIMRVLVQRDMFLHMQHEQTLLDTRT